jgi:DNA-binding response OmpR family regulator
MSAIAPPRGSPGVNGHVLIVDDDDEIRRVLRVLLEDAGFRVSEVPDGRLAVAEAARLQPDLILIDWVMPELDGCAASAQLKRNPRTAGIPIVMLSAKTNAADKVDALAAGVGDFVEKPFRRADVLAKVRRYVHPRAPSLIPPAARPARDPDELAARAFAAATRNEYGAAATEYSLAAEAAGLAGDPRGANAYLRLAGKMHLLEAEVSIEPAQRHHAYRAAARFFLAAGNRAAANEANASARAALASGKP